MHSLDKKIGRREFIKALLGMYTLCKLVNYPLNMAYGKEVLSQSLEDLIRDGYKQLASRTIKAVEQWRNSLTYLKGEGVMIYNKGVKELKDLESSGDIIRINSGKITELMEMVDYTISTRFIPTYNLDNEKNSLAFAFFIAKEFYNQSIEDFLDSLRIGHLDSTEGNAYTYFDGFSNILVYRYNEDSKALSIIQNIHELHHLKQPEREKVNEMYKELRRLKGMDDFIEFIRMESRYWKEFDGFLIESDYIHFLNQEHILKLAKERGIDTDKLKKFISINIRKLEILSQLDEGYAFFNTERSLLNTKTIPLQDKLYFRALTLLDTIYIGSTNNEKWWKGIGIVEFIYEREDIHKKILERAEMIEEYLKNL